METVSVSLQNMRHMQRPYIWQILYKTDMCFMFESILFHETSICMPYELFPYKYDLSTCFPVGFRVFSVLFFWKFESVLFSGVVICRRNWSISALAFYGMLKSDFYRGFTWMVLHISASSLAMSTKIRFLLSFCQHDSRPKSLHVLA